MNIRLQPNGSADKLPSARPETSADKSPQPSSLPKVPLPPQAELADSLKELKNWPVPGAQAEVTLCAYRPEDAEKGEAREMCAYRPAPEGKSSPPDMLQCAYFPENSQAPQIKTPRPSGQEIETILNKLRAPQ